MDFTYFQNFLNLRLEELVGINCTKVGLDMEPSSAILVRLSGSFSSPKLVLCSIQKMNAGTMTDEFIQNTDALSQTVSQLAEESHLRKKANLAIAAPGSLVITKKVAAKEGLTPLELNTFAWNEARKAFPGLADNLYLDYVLMPDNKLLLVAARKKELQERLNAIAAAGLNVEAVDVDYYALARSYSLVKNQIKEENKGCVGLINIDSSAMVLNVMQNGELIFFHRQSYHGGHLVGDASSAPTVSDSSKESLLTQINRLLQFFHADFPSQKITQVLISGRVALVPGLCEFIQRFINVPTELANPFNGLHVDYSLKQRLESQAPMLMLACGLAMRGLRS